jgi:hypothetical protein
LLTYNIGICGASISNCPWFTWVDFLREDLNGTAIENFATKGSGNEFIMRSALHLSSKYSDTTIIGIMLTNFDKFDQWVTGDDCERLKKEKHPPRWVDGTMAKDKGYWCTGSHFPGDKEKYKENYKDLSAIASQQLTELAGVISIIKNNGHLPIVMFDSPVLSMSEEQINTYNYQGIGPTDLKLAESPIIFHLTKYLENKVVDFDGLIGFCIKQNLRWTHPIYGPHPSCSSHLQYYLQKIRPWIKQNYPHVKLHGLSSETKSIAEMMTNQWIQNKF